MNENEMSQQERDAAAVERELKRCSTAYAEACAGLHRIRTERDAARADNARLLAACKDAPNVIYGAAILLRHVEEFQAADTLVAKADGIAAALAAPANGDGDGVK
jgi:3D (Asp-Asp-Asp) domain-containing protein